MRQPHRPRHRADRLALDDHTVDRLLTGTLSAANAPPGYARVAELLAATVAPPTPRELAGQAAVLAELRAVARARQVTARRAGPPRRRRRAGLAAVLVAGALATGGVAAAATGHLPGPVREAARSILTDSGAGAPATPTSPEPAPATRTAGSGGGGLAGSPATTAAGGGPGSTGAGSAAAAPNLEGLCQAFVAGNGGEQGKRLEANAFLALARAAGGADKVAAFCEKLLPADPRSRPKEPKQPDPAGGGIDGGQGGLPPTTGAGSGQGSPPADLSSAASDRLGNGTVPTR